MRAFKKSARACDLQIRNICMLKMGTEYPTTMNSTKILDSAMSLLSLKAIVMTVMIKKSTWSTWIMKLRRKRKFQPFVAMTFTGADERLSQRNLEVPNQKEY